jgi:Lysylphosphatidylglycerol synthase TM region
MKSFVRPGTILRVTLTIALLGYVAWRWVDWKQLGSAAHEIEWIVVVALILLTILQRLLVAKQGALYFSKIGVVLTTWQVARAQWMASFYGFALPGDIVVAGITWHLLSRENGGERSAIAAGLVYLRLLNYLMLIPLSLLGAALDSRLSRYGASKALWITGIVIAICIAPLTSKRAGGFLQRMADWTVERPGFPGWLKRAKATTLDAVARSHAVTLFPTMVLAGLAIAANLLVMAVFYLAATAISLQLPWYVALWMVGLQAVIYALPITFAGMGVREVSIIMLLGTLYGVKADQAILLSVIIFVPVVVVSVGGGGIIALLENLRGEKSREES